jgi:hypothetical protein
VQKKTRLIILITNITAPTKFNDEQSTRIRNESRFKRRMEKCGKLKKKFKKSNYRSIKNAENTGIYEKKKKADDKLNREKTRLREKLKRKARKRYFRNNNIIIFN